MMRLNADGLDESQFLPEKEFNPKTEKMVPVPRVNAFRAAKGDIVELAEDGGVQKAIKWFPDIMHRSLDDDGKPLFSSDHVHICESILNIILTTKAALGISDIRTAVMGMEGELKALQLDKFTILLTKLHPFQSNLCIWIVTCEATQKNIKSAKQWMNAIHTALNAAKKALDISTINERKKTHKKEVADSSSTRFNIRFSSEPVA